MTASAERPWRVAREVAAAGTGAAITDSVFNPMENIKVRLQLEGQRGRPQMGSQLYTGFLQCGRRVFAEEGLAGLWLPGLAATWARAYASTGVRIGLYPTVKRMLGASDGNASLPRQLAAGALTGCIGAALASPTDLVRVRLQGEAGRVGPDGRLATGLHATQRPSYRSTSEAFLKIGRTEGLRRGLWRGTTTSMARAALLSGSQLATYDSLKSNAKTACMPADTVKTRFMASGSAALYRNPIDCVVQTVRAEGALALYRGYWPALARQGPVMVVQMPLVEQLRRLAGLDYF